MIQIAKVYTTWLFYAWVNVVAVVIQSKPIYSEIYHQVPQLLHRVLAHRPGEGPHTVRAGGGRAGHSSSQEAALPGMAAAPLNKLISQVWQLLLSRSCSPRYDSCSSEEAALPALTAAPFKKLLSHVCSCSSQEAALAIKLLLSQVWQLSLLRCCSVRFDSCFSKEPALPGMKAAPLKKLLSQVWQLLLQEATLPSMTAAPLKKLLSQVWQQHLSRSLR